MPSASFAVTKRSRVDIPQDQPFANDKLSREPLADSLTMLVSSMTEPFVLTLSGPYGSGKTTFIGMWRTKLHAAGFRTIYFSAWENDFAADPLVALMAELKLFTAGLKMAEQQRVDLAMAVEEAQAIVARIKGPALRAIAKRVADGNAPGVADALATTLKREVDAYRAAKAAVADFQAKLAEVADAVATSDGETRRPFLIFVDELDRCRPGFAIEMLERIKHLFSVSGIVFVLAVHGEQIRSDVRQVFGRDADVDGFLRRFVDLDCRLPEPDLPAYCVALSEDLRIPEALRSLPTARRTPPPVCVEMMGQLAPILGFTLRDLDRIFTELTILFRTHPRDDQLFSENFVAFLVAVRIWNRGMFDSYTRGTSAARSLLDELGRLNGSRAFLETDHGSGIAGLLYAFSRVPEEAAARAKVISEKLKGERGPESDWDTREENRLLRELRMIEGVHPWYQPDYLERLRRRLLFADLFTPGTA